MLRKFLREGGSRGGVIPELSIGGDQADGSIVTETMPGAVRAVKRPKRDARDETADGVLTAPPNGALYHLDPSLAEKAALVRKDGKLELYVLASYKNSADLDSFRRAAALHLHEEIPAPQVAELKEIRAFNIEASEANLAAGGGTASRARLKDIISTGAAVRCNDIKMDIIEGQSQVRFQKDNFLSDPLSRFEMTAQEANALITSAFNYADQGDPVEKPGQDQKFTITDPKKLPPNVQTIRGQTAKREDGRRLDLRVIYKSSEIAQKGLEHIGLLDKHLDNLYYVQNVGAGLFTITAPTDNGKSTTLNFFSSDMVQAKGGHIDIIGIDDPVEFMVPEICQLAIYETEDGEDPFAQKIHTSLRLAPHGVKIGECRTIATANGAIDAAVTGKLVMTTQHTTGAFTIPFRYERMGVSRHVAYDSATHICWMSQRLVPALCDCSIGIQDLPPEIGGDRRRMATIRQFLRILSTHQGDFRVRGLGCPNCQGKGQLFSYPGLKGRVLAAEVILPSRKICELLAAGKDHDARRVAIIEDENPTMILHGFQLMREGRIGCEEFMNTIGTADQLLTDLEAEAELRQRGKTSLLEVA